jgi:hypothetical protein
MRWQPFYQFKTGLDQQQWDVLSTSEQRRRLRGSGKCNRKQSEVQSDENKEISWLPTLFPIRVVSRTELETLSRFELYW